ncbi:MAG TPA: hypothetical protein VNO75_04435 [Gemmatimonadaceae bacterium]|nr:hypothetical protein [Gemmatimonadaceae bacterium]
MRSFSLVALAAVTGCALPAPPPPLAEFLVSAGDQTYWVQSDHLGVKIRGSPLILARTGGRYYEVFVGEIDRSYPRALFAAERVFRREISSGDSAVIFEDSTILAMAADYQRTHPRQTLLAPDQEPEEEIDVAAVGETDVLNVLGPYVALEHRLSVGRAEGEDQEDTTRAVVDIRSGKRVTLEQVLDDSTVKDAAGEGGLATRVWKHESYDVVSRYDSTRKSTSLLLLDRRGREWKLGTISSSFVQIFWLDKPTVDAKTRSALAAAFDDATMYGGAIRQVMRKRQNGECAPPRSSVSASETRS